MSFGAQTNPQRVWSSNNTVLVPFGTGARYTYMAWVRFPTFPNQTWNNILDFPTGTNYLQDAIDSVSDSPNSHFAPDLAGTRYNGSLNAQTNTWYHYCNVRTSDTLLTWYVDGVSDGTNNRDISTDANDGNMGLGTSSWAEPTDVYIAYFKIWNVDLTLDEIKAEMVVARPIHRLSNLIAFLPFNGSTVSELLIQLMGSYTSGWANDGTPTIKDNPPVSYGSPIWYVPWVVSGGETQNITAVGNISSAEAFGTNKLNLNITAAGGITSVETFGNATVSVGGETQNITAVGNISTAEAFGTTKLNLNVSAAGNITSSEIFGTSKLNLNVLSVGGIVSQETFGSPALDLNIFAAGGISSAEAFGETKLDLNIISVGSIGSGEAFGTAKLNLNITSAGGIASVEVFGLPQISYTQGISTAGNIDSAEAFGTPIIQAGSAYIINAGNIASAEVFGSSQVNLNIISVGAIASVEAIGQAKLNLNITAVGSITSAEVFGNAIISFAALEITSVGDIASAEIFGLAQINLSVVSVGGITSEELFGDYLIRAVAKPDGDISLGGWTDQDEGITDIYTAIDETYADDNDYVKSVVSGISSELLVSLSDVEDPGIDNNFVLCYRYKKFDTKFITAQLVVTLLQGTTTIAYWTHPNVGLDWVDAEKALTEEQAGAITDFTDLRVKLEVVEV